MVKAENGEGNDQAAVTPPVDPVVEEVTPVTEEAPTDFDFRAEARTTLEGVRDNLTETHEAVQKRELTEWVEGELKDNVHQIVEQQQEICTEDGNLDACETGRNTYQQMFGEPYATEEATN